ncbi:MAG: MmcQ/YjbR family DNA-binding protein [Pseudonocardiaceae bacterium]|nr:MmcQ/YjbR family DNA-binding protein [Pseudonocardiaceae bacterium]
MDNLRRLTKIATALPEATRVDIEAWDGEPTFRVRGKNFVFADPDGHSLTVKLPIEEAEAVVATDPTAQPTGYGLGRYGWVSIALVGEESEQRWEQIVEWVHTSYQLVAPRRLARLLDESP